MEYYPDILIEKQSFLDRAMDLFTPKFSVQNARLFYKIIQR